MDDRTSKILIIDDEAANVRLLSMSLRSDGHRIVSALSGEEGLQVFRQENPDLVLTDIKMPGMDGIEVLKRIKAERPDVEVIIITGHGDIDNAIEALKFGASDFISKPVRDAVLAVSIERAREKSHIRRQLREYTDKLELKVQQATRDLQRQSNFLAKVVRSSNDGIIATDKELKVVVFNPGAELIFGYKPAEVLNQHKATDLLPPLIAGEFATLSPSRPEAGERTWKEINIRNRAGNSIPVRFYWTSLFEKGELMGTVSFFQDLREIKRLESELLRSERLAAIGQTVAGVAHGVKNILHGFKGGSYLVDIGIARGDTEKLKKGWDMIKRNIGRTSDLVMDLLSYSKERAPECRLCDPNDLVADVCEVMREHAESYHVMITTELDPAIGMVSIDPHSLHQCLTNLISNAIDACLFDESSGKQWEVRVRTARSGNDWFSVSISDNGMGMSPEVRQKLFSSFFSTKGHRGTGLGLLVTRKLVEEHGGTIAVDSEEGRGTTFTIELPFCRQGAEAARAQGDAA